MKRTLFTALTAIITAAAIASPIKAEAKTTKTELYAETFIVYEIDKEYNILYLMTFDGEHEFEYEYEDVENWHAGDVASALMDSKGTKKVIDDEIINLKHSGNIY